MWSIAAEVPSVKCPVLPSQREMSRFGMTLPDSICARTSVLLLKNRPIDTALRCAKALVRVH